MEKKKTKGGQLIGKGERQSRGLNRMDKGASIVSGMCNLLVGTSR